MTRVAFTRSLERGHQPLPRYTEYIRGTYRTPPMNQVPIGFPRLCLQTRASNLLLTIGVRINGLGQSTLQLAKWGIAGSFRPVRAHCGHALGHDQPGQAQCRVKITPRSPGTALAHVIRDFGSFPTGLATAQPVSFPQWQRHNFVQKKITPCIF